MQKCNAIVGAKANCQNCDQEQHKICMRSGDEGQMTRDWSFKAHPVLWLVDCVSPRL